MDENEIEEDVIMFCTNCGNEMSEEEQFCPNCGAPQETTASQPSQPPVPPVQGIGMPQGNVPYQNGAAVAVKKKNKMLPLIIIGSVVGGMIILVVIICIVAALRSDDFSIDTVKDGTLMDFDEGATIGEAFDDAFHDGSWYYDEDNDTDEKYVVFDGYFYSEDDDEIEVRIGFRHDPDVHDSNEFEVFAVELEDDYGDEADVSDDMEGFFNYIFDGDSFEWYWN